MKISVYKYNRNVCLIMKHVYASIGGRTPPRIICEAFCKRTIYDIRFIKKIWFNKRYQYKQNYKYMNEPPKRELSAYVIDKVMAYINDSFDKLDKLTNSNDTLELEPLIIGPDLTDSKKSKITSVIHIRSENDESDESKNDESDEESNIENSNKIDMEKIEQELPPPVNDSMNSLPNYIPDDTSIMSMMTKDGQEKLANIIFANFNLIKNIGYGKCELCTPIHPTLNHSINNINVCHMCTMLVMRQYMLHGFVPKNLNP